MSTYDFFRYITDGYRTPREMALFIVTRNGLALQFETAYNDDEELVLAAIKNNPESFQYASDRLKNDEQFVITAIKIDPKTFQYASDRLRNDEQIVLETIKVNPEAFQYASDRLRDDEQIVLVAVSAFGRNLRYVSNRLRNDKQIVLAAVKNNGYAIEYASEALVTDHDVVLEAIKHDEGRPIVCLVHNEIYPQRHTLFKIFSNVNNSKLSKFLENKVFHLYRNDAEFIRLIIKLDLEPVMSNNLRRRMIFITGLPLCRAIIDDMLIVYIGRWAWF